MYFLSKYQKVFSGETINTSYKILRQKFHVLKQYSTMEKQNQTLAHFRDLSFVPPDPVLGVSQAWRADNDLDKMNLGIGAYRDDDGKPYVFNVVKKALKEVMEDPDINFEYLPLDGLSGLRDVASKLLFGEFNSYVKESKIATAQSLSGTGALRVGFEFLKGTLNSAVYVSKPTWDNHLRIIERAGLSYVEYPYFDDKTLGLDFQGMCDSLKAAPPGSIILLHACAHNPTGVDPSEDQWKELAKLIKEKQLFPFFDCAYQGFASGNLEKDREAIQIFLKEDIEMLVAQSFSKNLGLYGERVGALHVVCDSQETVKKITSHLHAIIIAMYAGPSLTGGRIVYKILSNPEYTQQWAQEVKEVSERIQKMRKALYDELTTLEVKGNWDHIINQIGMFSYTGLTTQQCEALTDKHHIYLVKNGRISMAGVNSHNVKRLAQAIKDVVENC